MGKSKSILSLFLTLAILLGLTGIHPVSASSSITIPTISILSVVSNQTITIRTHNFPSNEIFVVRMGIMGTRGVGGVKVATINSGSGGSFDLTLAIPVSLFNRSQIAVRFESQTSGVYAYNWFYNRTTGEAVYQDGHIISGLPRIFIKAVSQNDKVTITTLNFPKNDNFDVLMGKMGTKGIGGIKVTSVSSAGGGILEFTFNIPAQLKGLSKIAIRLQSNSGSGYYAYNWFFNSTTASQTGMPSPGTFIGYPTMTITGVIKNQSVTFSTSRLPPNEQFIVLMGPMGSRGINGIQAGTFNSGTGDPVTQTVPIPAQLKGAYQIAIRIQSSSGSGYYAYNWFYNNTTP